MHIYRLIENKQISPTTRSLKLQNDEQGRPFGFQPGQYAAISFRHHNKPTPSRCFSITSSPTDQEILEFTMRVHGKFTNATKDLKPGDLVKVFGPFGGFMLNTAKDKNVVMIAGGIGITPFISMVKYVTRLKTDNKLFLLYSCRSQEDIPFKDDLIKFSQENTNFNVVFVIGDNNISKLPQGIAVGGRITPELIDKFTQGIYEGRRYFVCGPPPFMQAITLDLINKKVPKKDIMTESFSQASHPQSGILKSWPANIYALGAIGVFMGSATVMVNDLLNNYHKTSNENISAPYSITNARQQQIDSIVNSLPLSPSVIASFNSQQSINTPTSSTPTPTPTPTAPKPTTTPAPAPTPTPTPAPAPTPTPPPPPPPPPPVTTASSDKRLKESINYIGKTINDLRLYSFKYIGQKQVYIGLMAQDLLKSYPGTIVKDSMGFYMVNYGMLGMQMITLDQWEKNPNSIYLSHDSSIL